MAFEVLLQGASSHKALMDLQDYEIKYLEHMKKCVCHKIKVERDYSAALSGLASLFSKLESSEFDTSIFKLWRRMGQQMEVHAKKIRSVADYMCCSILDQMQQVISEKKAVKRLFQEESHRFQQNTDQQVQELARHTKQMSKCIDKWHKARENYKNSCASKGSLRHEEVKGRLVQGEASMNLRHNEHTLLLRRLNLLEKQKVATLLPSLLNTQQRLQTGLLSQCKNIVVDFVDLCKGEPLEDVKEQLLQLDCSSEYQAFAHSFKSESPKVTFHEFSVPSPFPPNDLLLNDVTVPLLKQIRDGYIEEMEKSRHWQRSKRSQLLQQSLPSNNILTKLVGARYKNLTQMQIVEKECLSERLQMMVDFIEDSVHNNQTRRDESSGTDDFESSNLPSCFSAYAELDGLDYEHFVEHMRSVWEEDSKWSLHHITSLFAFKKTHHNNNVEEIAANNIPNSNISKDKNNNNNNSNDVTTTFKNNKNASFNSCSDDPINNNNIDHVSNNNSNNNIDELNNNISTSPDNNISIDNYNDSNNNLDNNNNNINNNNIDNIKNDIINNNDVNDTNTESSDASRCALEAEEWYHGILPREEVQKLLLEEGDFLVRCSSNKKTHKALIVLSVCWQSAHKHFIVQEDQEGYRFEGLPHKSIRDLIMHLLHHNEAVTRKSGVVLRRAVVRMDWELKAHEVQLMEKLGSGQFGEVFKGVLLSSNQEVAVKTCRESLSVEQKRKFLEEGQLLKRYEHPNIVKFIGIVAHKHPVMVVMEYVDGGSLLTYLREEACMEERRLVAICKDCATGMQYLEKNKVLHRDLAARNCLIERSGVVKISDFGMSRQEAEYVISGGLKKIPIKWTAPEALNFGVYTSACDVWSYGVLMWEVFSKGTHPFLHLSNSQARMHIDNGYRMEQPQGCGDDVYQLMLQCWSHDPVLRPSFALILQSLSSLS